MVDELSLIRNFGRGNDGRRILSAFALASKVHARHVRDNGDPYILHPYRTAMLLIKEFHIRDSDIIAGALLHDVLEMSRLGEKRLGRRFGKRVARMVRLVTKPRRRDSIGWEERYYRRIRQAGGGAQLVKFADRLDNIRDLSNAPKAKQRRYLRATKERFLPWMKETDMRFYRKLRNEIRKFR
jgi:GTP pyrophosphokinase